MSLSAKYFLWLFYQILLSKYTILRCFSLKIPDLDSYFAFISQFREEKREVNSVTCLLGEFYLVSKNPPNSKNRYLFPGIFRFVLKLNSNSEYTNSFLEVHRRISNHVQKYTQTCYIQFHHSLSYNLEYK